MRKRKWTFYVTCKHYLSSVPFQWRLSSQYETSKGSYYETWSHIRIPLWE
jgi:hypothetical protein